MKTKQGYTLTTGYDEGIYLNIKTKGLGGTYLSIDVKLEKEELQYLIDLLLMLDEDYGYYTDVI